MSRVKLSIVIVNYNVKHYLEQCLHSVFGALKGIEAEVFVVDNNSVDSSPKMVKEKFPQVLLIDNKENLGFSKANNQAIRLSKGEYVLLLNPDTVVESNTFKEIIAFMDAHPEAGGLGVKMVNGEGVFLPESKRSTPTPFVAFTKIFGLSWLFPNSKMFGKYHLGYLSDDDIHEIDILSGAFMFLRKEALDKVGLLDETFFMYGEDIDLSYRLQQGGYKNYYFPDTRIIHYKGASTQKSSVNYVIVFYNAMHIFAKKHFSVSHANIFTIFIKLAIYVRAAMALLSRLLDRVLLPILDSALIFGGMYYVGRYWEKHNVYGLDLHFPAPLYLYIIPGFVLIWLLLVFLNGGYDKPFRIKNIFQGGGMAMIVILVIYALLNAEYRFSRALIMFGFVWAILSMLMSRLLLSIIDKKNFPMGSYKHKNYAIIGSKDEADRVADLLRLANLSPSFIGTVCLTEQEYYQNGFIGNINQLKEIIQVHKINEVIFCAKDISARKIIDIMSMMPQRHVEFRIAPPESLYIIGATSIAATDDLLPDLLGVNSINKQSNKRKKRTFDMITSLVFIILMPLLLFRVYQRVRFVKNIFSVLIGCKSWVGYAFELEQELRLPQIRPGVLTPMDAFHTNINDEHKNTTGLIQKLNMLYARNYAISNDLNIVIQGIRNCGRK